ncbi:PEP-CTERM sorting domain-containing protein [Novipirellula herctigrandis]
MKRVVLMAGLVMASLFSMGQANAAFVLIDNFSVIGTDSAAIRSTPASGVFGLPVSPVALSGGQATFEVGDAISYSNVDSVLSASPGLSVLSNVTVRINNISVSAGESFTVVASEDNFVNFSGKTITSADTFVEFTFATLPAAFTDLAFHVVSSTGGTSFTANGIYAVPEPATMSLIGLAACGGLIGFRRRRQAAVAS